MYILVFFTVCVPEKTGSWHNSIFCIPHPRVPVGNLFFQFLPRQLCKGVFLTFLMLWQDIWKSKLSKEEFILAHGLWERGGGEEWWQERKGAGHMTSAVKKEREMNTIPWLPSFFVSVWDPVPWNVLPTFRMGLSWSVYLLWKLP